MAQPTCLLPLSAPTSSDLTEVADRCRHSFTLENDGQNPSPYAECGAIALDGANSLERLAIVANTREEFAARLGDFSRGRIGRGIVKGHGSEGSDRVVFVCSGQGSQWAGMGAALFVQEPAFRSSLEESEGWIRRYAGWSLIEELPATELHSKLARAEYAQPAILAIEVALARLWESWGIRPAAVIGHSSGEVAAAHLAGALTLEDAVRVVVYSGQLLRDAKGNGGMAMVHAAPAAVANDLARYPDTVSIAAVNSPESIVVSGEAETVAALAALWRKRGIGCVFMPMEHAFHTPAMAAVSKGLAHRLSSLAARKQNLPIFSTVLGRELGREPFDASYWGTNLRQPVLFDAAVESALDMGYRTFLEVSPHPVLLASIEERCQRSGKQANLISSLRRRQDERFGMLSSLGIAFTIGCAVDWQALYPPGERRFEDSLPANSAKANRDRRGPPAGQELSSHRSPLFASSLEEVSVPRNNLIAFLCDEAREVLGLERNNRIDESQSLFEIGFDSLLAVQFRNRLSEALKVALDATLLFDYPTIAALAGHLEKRGAAAKTLAAYPPPDDMFLEAGQRRTAASLPERNRRPPSLSGYSLEDLKGMPEEDALELLEAELKL